MPQAKKQETAGKLASNRTNSREQAVLNEGGLRCASVLWDFSEDGGAADTIITLGRKLPAGAIIVRCTTDEQTAVTGATDADLMAGATEIVSTIDFTGDAGLQSRTANLTKLSAESEMGVRFNTAAATAGKVRFFVEYLLPTD